MSLDRTYFGRDYLYGRLLALAEKLETTALYASGINRSPTADRLMQQFSNRPYSTWLTIYKQLEPYMRQLRVSRPGFLTNIRNEIDEVFCAFDREEYVQDTSLSGEFLLGFHCQRIELRKLSELNKERDNKGV